MVIIIFLYFNEFTTQTIYNLLLTFDVSIFLFFMKEQAVHVWVNMLQTKNCIQCNKVLIPTVYSIPYVTRQVEHNDPTVASYEYPVLLPMTLFFVWNNAAHMSHINGQIARQPSTPGGLQLVAECMQNVRCVDRMKNSKDISVHHKRKTLSHETHKDPYWLEHPYLCTVKI